VRGCDRPLRSVGLSLSRRVSEGPVRLQWGCNAPPPLLASARGKGVSALWERGQKLWERGHAHVPRELLGHEDPMGDFQRNGTVPIPFSKRAKPRAIMNDHAALHKKPRNFNHACMGCHATRSRGENLAFAGSRCCGGVESVDHFDDIYRAAARCDDSPTPSSRTGSCSTCWQWEMTADHAQGRAGSPWG
jgi:hypothetical protein